MRRTTSSPIVVPCALAIGGLDPGGGAGILADARAIAAAGAFPCAAIAVVTVQSTAGMRGASVLPPREVLAQVREVATHQRVRAVKTGALGNAEVVRAIAKWLATELADDVAVVVDPVMAATRKAKRSAKSGATLLADEALDALRTKLVPRATLVTANAMEAERLTGLTVKSEAQAREAARAIVALGAKAALVKGGHLDTREAVDVLAVGDRVVTLRAARLDFVDGARHGGGCTLASLVAGRLARAARVDAAAVVTAVRWAKARHRAALAASWDVGEGARVLGKLGNR